MFFIISNHWCLCSISLLVSQWFDRHSLRDLCASWGISPTLTQAVFNSTSACTFCFYRDSNSARWELRDLSVLLWACTLSWSCASPTHTWGLLESQKCPQAFQNPLWTSHSPVYLFKLLTSSSLSPIVIHHFGHNFFHCSHCLNGGENFRCTIKI